MKLAMLSSLLALVVGCANVKEFVPIRTSTTPLRVPNQQRLIALSVSQAVANASREVNLVQYAGQSGRVEVNGVFPHSAYDLLDYIASTVEAEMARAGMRVIQHVGSTPTHPEGANAASTVIVLAPPAEQTGPAPDLRVIASVDWGGVDLKDQSYIIWPRLGGMLGVAGGGVVLGAITLGAGSDKLGAVAAGGAMMLLGPVAALIWRFIQKPTGHQFTLEGRVRITLRVIPNAAGLRPAQGVGDGESHIVIDPESNTGYTNMLSAPEK